MPRPKISTQQVRDVYRLYVELGSRPTKIHNALQALVSEGGTDYPDDLMSLASVKNYTKVFKAFGPQQRQSDQPFTWDLMESAGVPFEAAGLALSLSTFASTLGASFGESSALTFREVRWCWKVKMAAPDLDVLDIFVFGVELANREVFREALGAEVGDGDIAAFLAYAPWRSDDSKAFFLKAVENGEVKLLVDPTPRIAQMTRLTELTDLRPPSIGTPAFVAAIATGAWSKEYPELLPSQRLLLIGPRLSRAALDLDPVRAREAGIPTGFLDPKDYIAVELDPETGEVLEYRRKTNDEEKR